MTKKISLRKTYSVYASNLHLATMIFPFVKSEVKKGVIIKPILEKDISEDINKVIKNVAIDLNLKEKIENIDWKQTNIEKIKSILSDMENLIKENKNINIIVLGTNLFIEKVNELIDLWTKINFKNLEFNRGIINIINCYNFECTENIDNIKQIHEFVLKTDRIEEIFKEENFKKAN